MLGIIKPKEEKTPNKEKTPDEITLKPAPRFTGRFMFHWQHPNEAARVSFKSGLFYCVVSIVISVITTLISILLK
jgi:hypothetical protein